MLKQTIGHWFQPKNKLSLSFALILLMVLGGCLKDKGSDVHPAATGEVKLQKITFDDLSGWKQENFAEIIPVFAKNCRHILNNKNTYIYNSQIKIKTADYQDICRKFNSRNPRHGTEMKKFLESEFVPYAVADKQRSDGKFTSYYEATIRASRQQSERYKYPIYGKPTDLIEINLHDFDENLPNTRLVGRVSGNKFIPYYNRRDIEKNGINAPVLMWGDDLVDIHFMHIQGSAIAQMDDGSEMRIGYADSNGRKFKGIGSILLNKGLIKPSEASMPKIREWLRQNPQKAADLMAENERFIFQRLSDADGPVGAMGISLTAGRSMAVDNQYIPLGAMLWLDTYNPDHQPIRKIVFAQDIGSAIKGIVRGDYFWGHGEKALQQAGRMNSVGKYYILAPKYTELEAN